MKKQIRKFIAAVALALVLFNPFAKAADLAVEFKDAVATLTDKPCSMHGPADPASPLKDGVVQFKDSRPARKLCWVEEAGLVWIIDESMTIFSFDAENAKPVGVDI